MALQLDTQWAYAYGEPNTPAEFRRFPEDFQVIEHLPFEPEGEGEHVYLRIRKQALNTVDVVRRIARLAHLPYGQIAYAGLKDKQAVTTQWFSVYLKDKPEPDWQALNDETQLEILECRRHRKKLKRGVIQRNAFVLVLRAVQGERDELESRLRRVQLNGVPNYFGEQRFGREYSNLYKAEAVLSGRYKESNRQQRGLYYSAARAYLFNQVLSRRITEKNWNKALYGDAMALSGSRSFFIADKIDETLQQRLARFDIHPSGPLFGKGELQSRGDALRFELECLQPYREWCDGLIRAGVEQARRALRVLPEHMQWRWNEDDSLILQFALPSGSYATAVLRELVMSGK